MKVSDVNKYTTTDNTLKNNERNLLLQTYGLKKIVNDESFKNLLDLAKIICKAPIAYISILDDNYQYILAQDGADFKTIPIQDSFCQYTLDKKQGLIIEDTKKDIRTKNLPLVKANPSINFYFGSPLVDEDDNNLGAFCIMDYQPRELSLNQKNVLNVLSKEVIRLFQTRKKLLSNLEKIENLPSENYKKNEELERQLIRSQINLFKQNQQLATKRNELKIANFMLKQKPQELESIIDIMPACISFIDLNYCYQISNKVYEDWFGISRDELRGKHVSKVIGEEKFQKMLPIYERVFNGDIVELETKINAKKMRYLRVTYLPVLDSEEKVKGTFIFAEDLTEIKNYQEQLELSNKSLESFAYIASHDIKSPLRTIVSFGKLLKADLQKNNIDYKNEYLDYMIESGNRLESLTTDLLNYAKVQNEKVKIEKPCCLKEILQVVCKNLQTSIADVNAIVEYGETDIKLMVLENDLIQLLQNIISNGIKYQKKEKQPIIKIVVSQHKNYCKVIISDNGIGIKKQNLNVIFQPFIRLHTSSEYIGTGLGLATCKKIIEKYGSDLEVISVVNKGTTFSFSLPMISA